MCIYVSLEGRKGAYLTLVTALAFIAAVVVLMLRAEHGGRCDTQVAPWLLVAVVVLGGCATAKAGLQLAEKPLDTLPQWVYYVLAAVAVFLLVWMCVGWAWWAGAQDAGCDETAMRLMLALLIVQSAGVVVGAVLYLVFRVSDSRETRPDAPAPLGGRAAAAGRGGAAPIASPAPSSPRNSPAQPLE